MANSMAPNVREALFNALAVTDTGVKTSGAADLTAFGDYQAVVINSLNQAGNIQLQWSIDNGTTWTSIGSPIAAAATTNLLPATLPIKLFTGLIRFQYTASIAPGSGTISLYLEKRQTI